MTDFHDSLDAALARTGSAAGDDIETLASVLWQADRDASSSGAGFGPTMAEDPCNYAYRSQARYILASDWLAADRAAQRAEGAALARRATLDPGAFVKRGPDYDGNECGERLDQWQTRAIEAAIARGAR